MGLHEDAEQWAGDDFTAEEKEFMQWSMSSFFLGEERVTTELLPFAIAAPSHEARAFLATQISDEAQAHGLLRPLLPRGLRRRRRDAVAATSSCSARR